MIRKTLFVLFLLASFSFAAWQNVAAIAIFASLMLVTMVWMIGYGFGVEMLKVTAKDELYQLIALAFMVVVFFGANNIINAISTAPELAGTQAGATMQSTALLSLNSTLQNLSTAYSDVRAVDKKIGKASSQSTSCNLQYTGYSVSGCGAFSMLATPFSLVGSIMGFALGELNALYRLIEVALTYALPLLLPLGIILRTFKITRGAGGFLIAIGISMHILLPLGILFVDMLGDSFLASPEASGYTAKAALTGADPDCEAGDTGDGNANNAISTFDSLRTDMKSFLFLILIKATLGPVVAVLMMVAGIRFLSAIAGAEVDVSALARVI